MEFSIEQLGMAYRKAKVDLYYTTLPPLQAIADYESNLTENLERLQRKLNGNDQSWLNDPEILGGWTVTAKSLDFDKLLDIDGTVFSDANEEWRAKTNGQMHGCAASLRLMSAVSLDFHVLSALWISVVGQHLDKRLSGNAYGSRLRRTSDESFNHLSLGSFKPYLHPFREWRDGGISSMRAALNNDKRIVALTADVTSFYHELRPEFLLDSDFLKVCEISLDAQQIRLHKIFVTLLSNWAKNTPPKKGLPVGLPASAIVANLALLQLDRIIELETSPIYYGRYVDDILLVLENHQGFTQASDVWEWLFGRSHGLLGWTNSKKDAVRFRPKYLGRCRVEFANKKNKVFILSGASGKTLVSSIEQQIHERASEWRSLPDLPASVERVATSLAAATQSDGENADNLRKTSSMSMKRAGFAIKLRDYEAYGRDLEPDDWKPHRHAFFAAVIEHIIVPDAFFDLSSYLPRVIRLAVACEDFDWLLRIIERIVGLLKAIGETCDVQLSTRPSKKNAVSSVELMARWKRQLFDTFRESIIAAMPVRLSRENARKWATFEAACAEKFPELGILSFREFQEQQLVLFCRDLAQSPFRFIALPKEMVSARTIPFKKSLLDCSEIVEPVASAVTDGCKVLANWAGFAGKVPRAFLFATRPFSLAELYLIGGGKAAHASQTLELSLVLRALRGFEPDALMPSVNNKGQVLVPAAGRQSNVAIAVTSWKTKTKSWIAAVTKKRDPDTGRYARINRLINDVISNHKGAQYLVMPELSMKPRWFIRTAQKLQGRGISLITGVEYLHARRRRVHNQVWASLIHDGLGFPSMFIYRQDKQMPALHERRELDRLARIEMRPELRWRTPPIIQHGDFYFSLLICSELTNIGYRTSLRGEVDAIFVPEWNQDIETFNALVESAALDVHAYIVQCNDRSYGDSRIRAPSKDSWKRDILRVRGGRDDYCVTAEIDVQALRRFQSSYFSPDGPFKPVPDGFEIAHDREVLPSSE